MFLMFKVVLYMTMIFLPEKKILLKCAWKHLSAKENRNQSVDSHGNSVYCFLYDTSFKVSRIFEQIIDLFQVL